MTGTSEATRYYLLQLARTSFPSAAVGLSAPFRMRMEPSRTVAVVSSGRSYTAGPDGDVPVVDSRDVGYLLDRGAALVEPPDVGLTTLASGTITTPVAYLSLSLPPDYDHFELRLAELRLSAIDTPAMFLSTNGGVTWLNDATNFDTYSEVGDELYANVTTGALNGGNIGGTDSSIDLVGLWGGANPVTTTTGISSVVRIFPGDASHLAAVLYDSVAYGEPGGGRHDVIHTAGGAMVNPLATVTPIPARITRIALTPWGNGDMPPTSGRTITGGSYILWGIKS